MVTCGYISNTGFASAKVSALLLGLRYPIHIGGMVATEHRGQTKVGDFQNSLDMLFAQFEDSVARLEKLTTVYLDYPVNAMTAVCKKLSMPKKTALEAIAMFEMAYDDGKTTAQPFPKTNGGNPKMDVKSLAHTKWNCKYHIVFAELTHKNA